MIAGTQAQVLVHAIGIDDLARIHLPLRVPDTLKLAERLDQFLSKQLWQQFRARLAISMFTGE